jgi:transcriptional regulator with XRE-family HTH domain
MDLNNQMSNLTLILSAGVCTELGVRIRRLRLAKKITTQELVRMTQSSLSSIHRAEAGGHMTLDLLVRAAQSLSAIDSFDSYSCRTFNR